LANFQSKLKVVSHAFPGASWLDDEHENIKTKRRAGNKNLSMVLRF
jgi:hypothetical protein